MKSLLLIVIFFVPTIAQEGDRTYFQQRLVEARQGDAGAQDDVGVLYAEGRASRETTLRLFIG